MSITSVASYGSATQIQGFRPNGAGRELRQGMDQLKEALSSGDLEQAKSAYATLTELQEAGKTPKAPASGDDPFSTMMSELGAALESGDVSAAQAAFQKNGPQGAGGPPPGPPPGARDGTEEDSQSTDDVRKAFGQLAQALGEGDRSKAQAAYSSLSELLGLDEDTGSDQATSAGGSTDSASAKFKELMGDLGSALESGHMTTAKSLLSALAPRGSQGVDVYA